MHRRRGFRGGGPVPCWQMEGQGIGWLKGLRHASEVVVGGGSVWGAQ